MGREGARIAGNGRTDGRTQNVAARGGLTFIFLVVEDLNMIDLVFQKKKRLTLIMTNIMTTTKANNNNKRGCNERSSVLEK